MSDDPKESFRPKGTVEVTCPVCGWTFWIGALDPRLPDGPFFCPIDRLDVVKNNRKGPT